MLTGLTGMPLTEDELLFAGLHLPLEQFKTE